MLILLETTVFCGKNYSCFLLTVCKRDGILEEIDIAIYTQK